MPFNAHSGCNPADGNATDKSSENVEEEEILGEPWPNWPQEPPSEAHEAHEDIVRRALRLSKMHTPGASVSLSKLSVYPSLGNAFPVAISLKHEGKTMWMKVSRMACIDCIAGTELACKS